MATTRVAAFCLAIAAHSVSIAAFAQAGAWPARPVRIVAAQAVGSATDNIARILADALAEAWGQSVVVDNRPGAGGAIGNNLVTRANADGYTLLIGGISNMVTAPLLEPGFEADPESGFVAIGRVAYVPFVLAVHPDVPAETLSAFVDYVRGRPSQVVFAVSGPNSFSRLCMDLLAQAHGLDLLTVEYRGAPTAMLDLVAGRVQVQIQELAGIKSHADAMRVRLIAVAGERRAAKLPMLPTFAEAGGAPIAVTPWYGLFAPSGVALDVLARIASGYRTAMRDPRVIARVEALGYEPILDEPGQFAAALRHDLADVRAMARRVGRALH